MNRRERRAQERADAKAGRRQPVIIAGAGVVATSLGERFEAKPHAALPPKVPGQHRWIATASWVLSDEAVAGASDPDLLKFLDHENLHHLAIGCWDCERPLGAIEYGSTCPADGADG